MRSPSLSLFSTLSKSALSFLWRSLAPSPVQVPLKVFRESFNKESAFPAFSFCFPSNSDMASASASQFYGKSFTESSCCFDKRVDGKLISCVGSQRGHSGIKWFGIKVVSGIDDSGLRHLFKEFHQIFGLLILVILIFHIAGALKHSFVDKDGTLRRMWFSK